MPLPHPLSIFAIIFGILLTLRKLDVSHRQASQHPQVPVSDFDDWRTKAMAAYGLGVWACFLRLIADFAGKFVLARLQPGAPGELLLPTTPAGAATWTFGLGVDIAWAVALIVTWRRVRAAHALAERIGVEHRRGSARDRQSGLEAGSQGSPPASDA